ncbi:MAG: pyruvate kinase [Alphaproteobacteria bacterium]|nr:pyruvate kinase [Alphaproteobacteria bacterium]
MSQIKIVATIGPISNNAAALRALSDAGMNVARLNGSHNSLDWHAETIRLIRDTLPETPILLDIPGRKIRTTDLDQEPCFAIGESIVLTTDTNHDGREKVPVNYAHLHQDIKPNAVVYADDGTIRFTVTGVDGQDITCRAETAGTLKSRKGINVPGLTFRTELITDRDRHLIQFARDNEVDFVGISFVESSQHVDAIRALTGGNWPRIVSKVENQAGLDNVDDVVGATDVVMIDRGDLSVETNLENLAIFQKEILGTGRRHGKPVIVATEMLHTMIENPFPTKAEVSDISNTVLDGASATMLSGETAVGAHAVEAVATMRRVSDAALTHLQSQNENVSSRESQTVAQSVGQAISHLCQSLPISKIIAVTISGFAAQVVASYLPRQPIIAVSNDRFAARSFNIIPGTTGLFADIPFSKTSTDHIPACLKLLWHRALIEDDDMILVTALAYPRTGNRMNLIETHVVGDLAQTLGWERH